MGLVARGVLLVSSYAPLLALFAVLESFGPGWPTAICWTLAGGGVLSLLVVWVRLPRTTSTETVTFTDAKNRDTDVMAYVVSYVVPFTAAAGPVDDTRRYGLALFAVLLAALYLRASTFIVHPLLLLAGWHVYDGKISDRPVTLITRARHVAATSSVTVRDLSHNLYREVNKHGN